MKENYEELMNAKPLVKVDATFKMKHGQLFGFQTLEAGKINVAYPVWSHNDNEVQFVLFVKEGGIPCIDNDWVRDDRNCMYTNVEPIIVDIPVKNKPTTFQHEIASFFNG